MTVKRDFRKVVFKCDSLRIISDFQQIMEVLPIIAILLLKWLPYVSFVLFILINLMKFYSLLIIKKW